jgi:hypothetical protein
MVCYRDWLLFLGSWHFSHTHFAYTLLFPLFLCLHRNLKSSNAQMRYDVRVCPPSFMMEKGIRFGLLHY